MTLIPIKQIRIGEFIENCRDPERAGAIDAEFVQSLLQNGLIQPIEVRPIKQKLDGKKVEFFDLTAGERRVRHLVFILENFLEEFKSKFSEEGNGYKLFWNGEEGFLEASFFKGNDTEAQIRNLEENRRRSDLLPTEIARGIQLIRNKGGTYEDAASVIGKSKKIIEEMHEWFKNSTAELKKATDEGLISLERSKGLAECAPSEQRGVIDQIREILANTPSKKEGKEEARLIVDKVTGRQPKPSPVVAFTPSANITLSDAPEGGGNGKFKTVSGNNGDNKPRGSQRSASGLRQFVTTLEERIDECHKRFDDEALEDLDRQRIGEDLSRYQGVQEALLYVLGDLNELSINPAWRENSMNGKSL